MPEVSLDEAAKHLGVTRSTVVRRIKAGIVAGRKQNVEGTEVWRVTLPNEEDAPMSERVNGDQDEAEHDEVATVEDAVDVDEAAVAEDMALEPGTICPVCQESIEDDDDYVKSAHGEVHAEPCSHKTIPLTRPL